MKRPLLFDNTHILDIKGESWTHTFVDPGRFLVYGLSWAKYLEFMPGETYYMAFDLSGVFSLTEEEALALFKNGEFKRFEIEPIPEKEAVKTARKQRPRFEKGRQKMVKMELLQIADLTTIECPEAPVDKEGYVQIPANERVKLTLLENVSGLNSTCGEDVWFEVAEDCVVDGTVWTKAGTIVTGKLAELSKPASGGHSGRADILIQAIPATDGTLVPASGQWIASGTSKVRGAAVAFGFIGAFSAAIKGKPAFESIGLSIHARTRAPVWIQKMETESATTEDAPVADLKPIADMNQNYDPTSKIPAPAVQFMVESPQKIEEITLQYVNGRKLAEPATGKVGAATESGYPVTFAGWDLLNHVKPFEANELLFQCSDSQGTAHYATMKMNWRWSASK